MDQAIAAALADAEAQRKAAEASKAAIEKTKSFKEPIVTPIAPATDFWPAEDYHQDYLVKHPRGYTCHYLRSW